MFQTIQAVIYVAGGLLLTLMVCLSLPKSKLREFLTPLVGWALAVGCGIYVISPLDVLPDVIPVIGWMDDVGAIAVGVGSAMAAITAKGK